MVADFRLGPSEAEAGINIGDSFSPPSGFVGPILDHADYRVTFSSSDMYISISGNTITMLPVPEPESWVMLLVGFVFVMSMVTRKQRSSLKISAV